MKYQQQLISTIFKNKNVFEDKKDKVSLQSNSPALAIYQNNYIENGIRALSICFATVYALMDEHDFRKLAHEYLLLYPKTCFDWADYGDQFSDFMLEIDAIAEMPYLPELAELDWRLMHIERLANQVFDSQSFGKLQTTSPELLKFVPAPGLQTMQVLFPVFELYQLAHDFSQQNIDKIADLSTRQKAYKNKKLHMEKTNDLINSAISSPVYRSIVLWREDFKGMFEYCEPTAVLAFNSMLENKHIAQVLSHFGEDQTSMANWLHNHIQSRKIYAIVNV